MQSTPAKKHLNEDIVQSPQAIPSRIKQHLLHYRCYEPFSAAQLPCSDSSTVAVVDTSVFDSESDQACQFMSEISTDGFLPTQHFVYLNITTALFIRFIPTLPWNKSS